MKFSTAIVAVLSTAGVALAQGVTSAISPAASAPAGCSASYDGSFEITVAKVEGAQKRDGPIAKRSSCTGDGILLATLADSVLTDSKSRTGYIASNYQFQFDEPPQAGSIYTAGFTACENGSLALGGSAVWYECESGDFYNLYDRNWAAQCSPVEIIILPCGSTSETSDGEVVGTEIITTTIVSALGDGQPQVKTTTTGIPICQVSQISDGQVQVGTTPCASITSTPTSTLAPVSQYSDGQIQVTPAASVPTVTSAAETTPAETTPAAGTGTATGTASVPEVPGTSVTLPTETQVTSGGVSVTGSVSTTLATTSSGGHSSGASGTTASASAGTSAPASSGAAPVKTGSVVALVMALLGAIAFF